MAAFLLAGLFLLAVHPVVHTGGAALRESCSADAQTLIRLEAGAEVQVRFAFSGDLGTCYKVTAGERTGYVLAAELTGLDRYEQARARASDRDLPQMIRAEIGRLKEEASAIQIAGNASPTTAGALRMLERNQPRQALEILENSLLRGARQDPFLLSLAGLAAYQSDQPRRAIELWTESLQIKPNSSVEALLNRARRELSADTSRAKVHGSRFDLRYNDGELTREQAGGIMAALDAEYQRIDLALGCGQQERITAVVMNRGAYQAATGAAEWSGGQFDGRIRVVLPAGGLTPRVRQVFAHEIVHACLARQGQFPGWFHEGMAQRWSGESPSAGERAAFRQRLRNRQMPSLNNLSATFSRMSAQHAALAYAYAWEAVDTLYRLRGDQYVRNLLRNPNLIPQVADQLTTALIDR